MIARFFVLSAVVHTAAVLAVGQLSPPMNALTPPSTLHLSLVSDAAPTSPATNESSDEPSSVPSSTATSDADSATPRDAASGPEQPAGKPTTQDSNTSTAGQTATAPQAHSPEPIAASPSPSPSPEMISDSAEPDDIDSTADSPIEPVEMPNLASTTPQPSEPDEAPAASAEPVQTASSSPAMDAGADVSDHQLSHARSALADLLAARFVYPPLARSRGWEGRVDVEIELSSDGTIANVRVVRSSGHRVLDRDAVRTLERIGNVPGAADWLHGRGVAVALPVIYRLVEG